MQNKKPSKPRAALAGVSMAALFAVAPAVAQAEDLNIAAVSGYFAQGFGISIVNGLERAQEELGVDVQIVDTGQRALDFEEQFNNLARSGDFDVILVMGWELVDALMTTAGAHPEQRFVFIDGVLESDNITYIDFIEEEGSFLAGALSSMLVEQGVEGFDNGSEVGFVGGRDIPVIRNFLMGMEQGVASASQQVGVSSVFAGSFDDPAKGFELAMTLYGQGVDIIYQAAGPTGEGVLQAARAAGKYAIGVDIDQCPSAPGHILASMLKRADIAVFDLIEGEVDGSAPIEPGTVEVGVASGGVELKICEDMMERIPAETLASLEEMRAAIASGEIDVALNR